MSSLSNFISAQVGESGERRLPSTRHQCAWLSPFNATFSNFRRQTYDNNIVAFAVVLQAKTRLTTMTKSTDGCISSQVLIVTKADLRILNLYMASARFITLYIFGGVQVLRNAF